MLKRWLLSGLIVVLAGAFLSGGYAFLRLHGSLPQLDGEVTLEGLGGTVLVERDAQGVVTVRAKDQQDMMRALGFVHGQDRFFQMDLLRRSPAGELSQLFGPATLDLDRRRRVHRLRHLAGLALRRLPPIEHALLQAYTEGVNAGVAALRAPPFEYLLLDARPRKWQMEDTLLVAYSMALDLQDEDAERDARYAVLHAALPAEVVAFLVPRGTSWDAPLEGGPIKPPPIPEARLYDLRRRSREASPPLAMGRSKPMPVGSNAWAVDARRARDGRAWLANDMHLGLAVPTTWYRARLVLEGDGEGNYEATGVTLPGAPVLIAGSNGWVAWGFTNSYGDWSDRVELQLHPSDPQRYRTPDGYYPLDESLETIRVRGAPDHNMVVRTSRWGPVIHDFRGQPQAIRWLMHAPDATNLALLDLLQARNVDQAVAIANRAGMPVQNFHVADAHGDIAWTLAGRLPEREAGASLPMPWSEAGEIAWLAPQRYPRVVRPAQGRIWSANARMLDGAALAQIGDGGYALGARQQQIRDVLLSLPQASVDDLLALQLDDRAVFLRRWHRLLLELLQGAALEGEPLRAQARALLEQWDARAAVDSVGYRLVAEWRATVHDGVFNALTQPCRNLDPDFRFQGFWQAEAPLWTLVTERPPHLLNPRYADWRSFLLEALDVVLASHAAAPGGLAARTWGERNLLRMQHPLARAIPALSPWLDMPSEPLPGDVHMPRVQGPRAGASQRMAVSPGAEAQGYFHMPGGQSGHPLSSFYRAGHAAWVNGEPTPFLPGTPKHHLWLRPASREAPS